MGLVVEHINKSFAQFQVIKDLSMEVKEGTIFGFLGANGAGKTTTMRMILDILRPDSGRITWNGKDVHEVPRKNWGYLPEERGLYPKMRVDEQLLFLARLNGVSKQAAEKELDEWLGRFQINANRKKKVEELSKGNQQKVIFSTHQLEQVEELCQDIVIINKGQSIVQGSVQEVKRQQGRNVARLKLDNDPEARWLDTLEGAQVTKRRQDYI